MMFTITTALVFSSIVIASALDPRQQQCNEDGCYRAVWGDGSVPRVVRAAEDCEDYLTTSIIWYPV